MSYLNHYHKYVYLDFPQSDKNMIQKMMNGNKKYSLNII